MKRTLSMAVARWRLASSACATRSARARTGYITEIANTHAEKMALNSATVAIVIRALIERPHTMLILCHLPEKSQVKRHTRPWGADLLSRAG
ncbi:hypothetical protein ACTWPT_39075 [Nonomuraea sp. 3N208]|uniref:hypothetical protein n=1 Tax=Nonomuraea sp. 3N208 TaxID=3457421 RepID=UPI003FD17E54